MCKQILLHALGRDYVSQLMRPRRGSVCLCSRVVECLVFIRWNTQGVTEGPSICGQYWLSSSIPFARNPQLSLDQWGKLRGLIRLILTGSRATLATGCLWCSSSSDPHRKRFANIQFSRSRRCSAGNSIRLLHLDFYRGSDFNCNC